MAAPPIFAQVPLAPILDCQTPCVDALAELLTTTTPAKPLADDPSITVSVASEKTPENKEDTVAPSFTTFTSVEEVA